MNLLVCVKQVPDTAPLRMDPRDHTLVREDIPGRLSPYDGGALAAALRIRSLFPDTRVVTLSMGPPQAEDTLRQTLALGADRAYLVTDPAFRGSDAMATSYILRSAISQVELLEEMKFDAVFCGGQSIDGGSAAVGPALAQRLSYPQVTGALEAANADGTLCVLTAGEEGCRLIGVKTPCLVTFAGPSHGLPSPTAEQNEAAMRAEVVRLTAAQLPHVDPGRVGLAGSATQVRAVVPTPPAGRAMVIREETGQAAAQKLFELLHKSGAL